MSDPVYFIREGNEVIARVTIATGHVFDLRWNAGSEWAASLLLNAIRDAFSERIVTIRVQSYNDGWAAAKAKKAKQVAYWIRTLWVRS